MAQCVGHFQRSLQRSDEALPIFEFATQVDEDGDGRFDRSNNIFADAFEGPRYSPLWFLSKVRVVADYLSIDTTDGRGVGLTDERQFYDPATQSILPSAAAATSSTGQVLSVTEERETLINCPFERPGGGL